MVTTETTLIITIMIIMILFFMVIFYGIFHLSDVTLESSAFLLLSVLNRYHMPYAHQSICDYEETPIKTAYHYRGYLNLSNPIPALIGDDIFHMSVYLRFEKYKKEWYIYASEVYNRVFEEGIYDVDK